MQKEAGPSMLYMSTFPPRECGIATFTQDLLNAIDRKISPLIKSDILAMNRNGVNIYNYSKKVSSQISDTDMNDYVESALKINSDPSIKLVNIQHEYGIFGGEYGDYLSAFLEILEKPSILTLHSVLPSPNDQLKKVTQSICNKVNEIVVMTNKAKLILEEFYGIKTKINIIPHGIHSVPFESQTKEKIVLGLQNRIVLSSFGLLSEGKGYEYVIEALPEVVKRFPNLIYIIVGETHPNIRKKEGEKYRNFLSEKIESLGLQKHVKFYNKYAPLSELIQYLRATNIYMFANLDPNQVTSGVLSYALGSGRAVIATPILHAKDAIKHEETGMLVDFKQPKQFEQAILALLENKQLRKNIEKNVYHSTRSHTWSNVAAAYTKIFKEYLGITDPQIRNLPKINTSHLQKMTDDFGIIQFAEQTTPLLNSGYTLDDNARALIASSMHYQKYREFDQLKLIRTYLDYINYVQDDDGRLHNMVNIKRVIDKKNWSQDAHGRAIWALGHLISSDSLPKDFKREAEFTLAKALPMVSEIHSPRALAFTISGLHLYNKEKKSEVIISNIKKLGDELVGQYKANSKDDWHWFEPYLTYSNSKLSEALLHTYEATREPHYLEFALESLEFLISKTFNKDTFAPIGHRGWYKKEGQKALYDQQPIDVSYMVQTLILAHKVTQKERYKDLALNAFQWFLGKNSKNQMVYNEDTGGCHDGLGEGTINLNQGAESTVSYLIARLSL